MCVTNKLVRSGEAVKLDMKLFCYIEHKAEISTKKNQKIAQERREARKGAAWASEIAAVARPSQCY